MPIFGSTKGKEYQLNLEDLKLRFDVSLRTIENLDYDILDVKQTKWHDDFGQNFKEEVKGIETFYTTIINNIFKYVSTCSDAVEMLENFQQLSKRASVQEYVHTKAASRVYEIFLPEVKEIETQFDLGAGKNKRPPMPVSHPQYGGLAIWALSLITRLNKIEELMEKMYFVPNISIADDVKDKFHKLSRQLDGYIANVSFREWTNTLEDMSDADAVDQKLAVPVLRKAEVDPAAAAQQRAEGLQKNSLVSKTNEGKLRSNFNVHLLKVINECTYWNKIQANGYISMPHSIVTLI
jgi:dynein heavy chain